MKTFLLFLCIIACSLCLAQNSVGIGTTTPHASARLEIADTTKGILIPRMTAEKRAAIGSPATGLQVYQTDGEAGFYYYNGTAWLLLSPIPAGSTTGDMLYWNGTRWITIAGGTHGQALNYCDGKPTWGPCNLPVISTSAVTVPPNGFPVSGITINGNGGSSVTTYGICWSVNPLPTTSDAKSVNVAFSQSFPYSLARPFYKLLPGTTYYIRAYAINANGTAYGNQVAYTTPSTLFVGRNYNGGIIYYIDNTSLHGLIAAETDQGGVNNTAWGCNGVFISGATGTAIGTGEANTAAIVTACATNGIAARLCADLVLNGQSDWYLPSRDEFANLCSSGLPLSNSIYYTSSQFNATNAYYFSSAPCILFSGDRSKDFPMTVRAVRSF
ncbi:MAG: hypothetical protein V4722_22225 [Bacteroidota bacterium]